jgi:flagellar motor switch/type III secretory pathway protein FliN
VATVASIPPIQHETTSPAQTATPVRPGSAEDLLPWLPCTLGLEVPVVNFTVGFLLKLRPGSLVHTACHQSTDLPLNVNGVLMAWTEFEVVGERLAARITDLV